MIIVTVEIYFASKVLHVFGTFGTENIPRLIIHPIYEENSDILKINFVNVVPSTITFKNTEAEDIKVRMDNDGKIVSLLFYNASNRILKTVSEEDRVIR